MTAAGVQLPEAMVQDTIAAVFADPAFQRTSLLQRIGAWLAELIEAILVRLGPVRTAEPIVWFFLVLLAIALGFLLVRVVLGLRPAAHAARARGVLAAADGDGGDAWRVAGALAERGEYTAAAHALYAALLRAIAGAGDVDLHESKTSGDYARELVRRASPRAQRFRDFARSYEFVIYGLGVCDRARYERLDGLARQIAAAHG